MSTPDRSPLQSRLELLPVAAGIIIAALLWPVRLRFPFDDAYITFRYAEHVASGYGFIWNIGGPHTEGFTNLLFVLILAAARLVTRNVLVAAQVISLLATILTGLLLYRIGSEVCSAAVGLLAAAFFLLTPLTWINALSGMETSLFVMWTALAMYAAIRARWYFSFGAVFLATLTRPEGALLGLILVVVSIRSRWDVKNAIMKDSGWMPAISFAIALLMYACWKWWYFGGLLPNSFYVKVLASSRPVFPGMQYVRLFIESMVVLILLSIGIRKWRSRAIVIAAVWTVALLVFYLFVLPLEGLYDRFLWPAFSMSCLLAAIGVHDIAQCVRMRFFSIPAVVAIVFQIVVSLVSSRTRQSFAAHEEVWDASMDRIVTQLQSLPHFDSLRLAYGDAGYVVYRSGIQHIDLFGLNDTRIARAKSREARAAIIRSERSDILLLPVTSSENGEKWVEDAYGFAHGNEFEPVASTEAFPYTLVWLLNTDGPYYRDCKMEFVRLLNDSSSHLRPAPSTR